MPLLRVGLSLLVCCILSPALTAQDTLSVSVDILTAGQSVDVTFNDPNRGGETVTITVHGDTGVIDTLYITLDAAGRGTTSYVVPSGHDQIEFLADDGARQLRLIE